MRRSALCTHLTLAPSIFVLCKHCAVAHPLTQPQSSSLQHKLQTVGAASTAGGGFFLKAMLLPSSKSTVKCILANFCCAQPCFPVPELPSCCCGWVSAQKLQMCFQSLGRFWPAEQPASCLASFLAQQTCLPIAPFGLSLHLPREKERTTVQAMSVQDFTDSEYPWPLFVQVLPLENDSQQTPVPAPAWPCGMSKAE